MALSRSARRPDSRPRTGQLRLGVGLAVGTFAYILPFAAVVGVLLPARLAELAPDRKVTLLAVLVAATAVAGLVGNVVSGTLADRTRSSWGPRVPWLVGGAVVGSALLVPVAGSRTFAALLVWWCLAVVALNAMVAAVAALLAERVPRRRRATVAAAAGAGNLVGVASGTWLGAATLTRVSTGILVVAGLVVVLTLVAAGAARPGSDTTPDPPVVPHRPVRGRVADAVPSPRRAPDFYRALLGRLLLVGGYFMVHAYQLYVFTDHLRLPPDTAAAALGQNALVFLVTALLSVAVAGPASDRRGRRRTFVAGGALVFAVGTGMPVVLPSPTGMLLFSAFTGVGFGVVYSVDAALMTEVLPRPDDRGRDLGVLNTANIGGQVLAPAASSALLGLGLGFGPVFLGSLLAGVLGGACVLTIRSVR